MADTKKKYLDIEIKEGNTIQYLSDLAVKIEDLKSKQKDLKDTTGTTSKEYIELTAKLKGAQKEYNQQQNTLTKIISTQNDTTGSLKSMSDRLAIVTDEWNRLSESKRLDSEEGKALTAEKAALTAALTKEEVATGSAQRQVGQYNLGIKQTTSSLASAVPALGKAGTAAKILGVVMNTALGPIGLIVAAISLVVGAVKSFASSSEEGQDQMDKWGNAASATFNVITDRVANFTKSVIEYFQTAEDGSSGFSDTMAGLGDSITEKFQGLKDFMSELWDDPKKVFDEFADNTTARFQSVKDNISSAFDVISANFSKTVTGMKLGYEKFVGFFTDNTEDITKAQEEYTKACEDSAKQNEKVTATINKISDAVSNSGIVTYFKELGEEISSETAKMDALSDRTAALAKKNRANLVENAKVEQEIAKLRAIASEKETVDADKRLKAINDAIDLEMKKTASKIALKKEEYLIQKGLNDLGLSDREALDKQAKLESELYNLQTESFKQQKSLQAEKSAALKEVATETLASMTAELQMFLEVNREKANSSQEISDIMLKSETDRLTAIFNKETEFIKNKHDLGLLAKDEFDLEMLKKQNAYNDQILSLETQLSAKKKDDQIKIEAEAQAEKLTRTQQYEVDLAAAKQAIAARSVFAQIEADKVKLDTEYANAIENANRIGADTLAIEESYQAQKTALQVQQFQAAAGAAAGFATDIAQIAGENTKVGRAAAATAAGISALQGATAAFAALAPIPIVGPVLGTAAAAAALTAGYLNVKKILNTKSGLPGDSGGGSNPSGGATYSPPTVVQNDINRGLATRNSVTAQDTSREIVLVIDDVTAAQNNSNNITDLSSL